MQTLARRVEHNETIALRPTGGWGFQRREAVQGIFLHNDGAEIDELTITSYSRPRIDTASGNPIIKNVQGKMHTASGKSILTGASWANRSAR